MIPKRKPISLYSPNYHKGLERKLNILLHNKLTEEYRKKYDTGFLIEIDEDTPQRVLKIWLRY